MKVKFSSLLTLTIFLFLQHAIAQSPGIDYGASKDQVELLNVDCLHAEGYTGRGVTIAHFDDGYDGFDQLEAFEFHRKGGLFKGAYDFVENSAMVFKNIGSHGLNTVSITSAYLPGDYVGTGYEANILLARTEDNRSETNQEEINWRTAVDWALDNRADVITSSLQYNNFDEGQHSYTYKDMDGNTATITKAADYASAQGILVVAIQGNFGSQDWRYVTAPGDADSVLTVGAADRKGKKAGFSSFGPTHDGRVKPDVMAVGQQTAIINPDGSITTGNGTSFAAPAIAGMVACLIQAHPDRSNMEIIAAVRQSADRYTNPDKKEGYGYGIPDACKAHAILTVMDKQVAMAGERIAGDQISYQLKSNKLVIKPDFSKKEVSTIQLFNAVGEAVDSYGKYKKNLKIKELTSGLYLLVINKTDGTSITENIILP